jgi:hypothetical protein
MCLVGSWMTCRRIEVQNPKRAKSSFGVLGRVHSGTHKPKTPIGVGFWGRARWTSKKVTSTGKGESHG